MKIKSLLSIKFVLLTVIVGGSIFLLFFNPYLQIKDWEIEGIESAQKRNVAVFLEKLTDKKILFLPQNNFLIFLIKQNSITKLLETQFREIEDTSISLFFDKNFFNRVKIIIKERTKDGIICPSAHDANCFFFDKTGLLFKQSPESRGPFILSVKDNTKDNFRAGDKIENENLVNALIYLKEEFSDITVISIKEIKIINQNYDFILQTNNDWNIYFDPQVSIERQLHVLKTLFAEKKINAQESLEYIDLRIKNKAYLKR